MDTFYFEGTQFTALKDETVLDCLLRKGVKVTNSCKSGICHSCILKSTSSLDDISQKGLSSSKKEAGFFLSCQQKVAPDLEVFMPDSSTLLAEGEITSQERVTESVVVLKIQTLKKFSFKAGQFTNIIREDGVCRSYSIASQTGDQELEFHIRKVPDGVLSNWLYDEELIGKKIQLSEPLGECCLNDEMDGQDLLLIGVGTGLAPLFGVLKDSISSGKMGAIKLFHGGLTADSLYMVENLKAIDHKFDFFSYHPVFLKGEDKEGFLKGNLVDLIKNLNFDKKNTIVMICGDPLLVKNIKQSVFLSGVPSKSILSDPFVSHSSN
jgi:NAD(P)H-flavin reductase/ferredoxin